MAVPGTPAGSSLQPSRALLVIGGAAAVGGLVLLVAALLPDREDASRPDDLVQVRAFLDDDLLDGGVDTLVADVRTWPGVEEVVFFSKADALDEARELFADDPQVLGVIEGDPSVLPASLRIAARTAGDADTAVERLRTTPGVREAVLDAVDQAEQERVISE